MKNMLFALFVLQVVMCITTEVKSGGNNFILRKTQLSIEVLEDESIE